MYVEHTGGGPPVLALPGLGGGAWFFSGLARRLTPDYRVLSLDLPGTGRSPAGRDGFTAESWVDDLGGLLADCVDEPAVVVGHSLGTILALRLWQTHPERVRALVFVGGLPEARPTIRERLAQRAEAVAAAGLAGWGVRAAEANFARAAVDRQPETVAMFERLFELQDAPRRPTPSPGCCAGSSHRCVRVSRYEHAASLFTRAAGRVPPGADR
jgi:pimeloyl-ACP methyl ester carboxylesterase